MTLVLQKGRPADTTGRLDKEIRTYDLLDGLGVEYDRVDHAPAMTMEDCKEVDEILESMVCKIMRCDSDSGKKLIKSMVLRTADRQGMC